MKTSPCARCLGHRIRVHQGTVECHRSIRLRAVQVSKPATQRHERMPIAVALGHVRHVCHNLVGS